MLTRKYNFEPEIAVSESHCESNCTVGGAENDRLSTDRSFMGMFILCHIQFNMDSAACSFNMFNDSHYDY